MATENELYIPISNDPRFQIQNEMKSGGKVFSLDYQPHIGLMCPDPQAIMLAGAAFQMFNPVSLAALKEAKVGDLIHCTCDPTHEIYKFWNPPADYAVEQDFSKMYRVRHIDKCGLDLPIIIADAAI